MHVNLCEPVGIDMIAATEGYETAPVGTKALERSELNLVDRVYRSLRAGIVNGTYAPDAPLRLQTVAKEHKVSLIPVREALRLLESERLVIATPNKGARVAPISLACLKDLYQTRKVIEVEALLLAAPNLDAASIGKLRVSASRMAALFEARDTSGFLTMHREFHLGIYQHCGSVWLMHIIEILSGHADRYIQLAVRYERSATEILEQHLAILDKLEAGDFEGAASSLIADLDNTIGRVQSAIRVGLAESSD